jgi:D-sedoheptulose 7-phosphate isomerase
MTKDILAKKVEKARDTLKAVINIKRWSRNTSMRSFPLSSLFLDHLAEHRALFTTLDGLAPDIDVVSARLAAALQAGGKVMFCGNGGSAADSQHLAAELTGRFVKDRRPLAAIALSTDSSALTCIGNDYGFEDVFDRQVRGLGCPGDVLIGISTSGNSPNVLKAFQSAHAMGITTVGLLGRDGGKIRALSDMTIIVPSWTTTRIQEAHIMIGHVLCAEIEAQLGLADGE